MKPEQEPDRFGKDDDGGSTIDPVDHEQRERSYGRQKNLVTPTKIKNIVSKTKEYHATDGEQCTDELGILGERERERTREQKNIVKQRSRRNSFSPK